MAHRQIRISATNSSRSAYASVELNRSFFQKYKTKRKQSSEGSREAICRCQLLTKPILSIFRSKGFDKNLDNCELRLDDSDVPGVESRFVIKLHFRQGIKKTYKLTYESDAGLRAVYDRHSLENRWKIGPSTLKEWVDHFHSRLEEVTFSGSKEWVSMKSFTEGQYENGTLDALKRPMQTELAIGVDEFEEYTITADVQLTFSLREFKALILLAESSALPIEASFSTGGRPLVLAVETDAYAIELVIATIAGNGTTQPSNPPQIIARSTRSVQPQARPRTTTPAPRPPPSTLANQRNAADNAAKQGMGGDGFGDVRTITRSSSHVEPLLHEQQREEDQTLFGSPARAASPSPPRITPQQSDSDEDIQRTPPQKKIRRLFD